MFAVFPLSVQKLPGFKERWSFVYFRNSLEIICNLDFQILLPSVLSIISLQFWTDLIMAFISFNYTFMFFFLFLSYILVNIFTSFFSSSLIASLVAPNLVYCVFNSYNFFPSILFLFLFSQIYLVKMFSTKTEHLHLYCSSPPPHWDTTDKHCINLRYTTIFDIGIYCKMTTIVSFITSITSHC